MVAVGKIGGFLRLIRPLNCMVMSLAFLVGASLAGIGNIHWLSLLYGGVTAFTLTGAAMAVNDYYDFDIDKINEPLRPIPTGDVSMRAALLVTGVLTAVGFVFAFAVSLFCFLFATVAWAIMVAYSTFGKRSGLAGNLLVSACVAAPFLYAKSFEGSMAMFAICLFGLLGSLLFFSYLYPISIFNFTIASLGVAAIATACEALTPRGFDNLTVPLLSAAAFLLLTGGV